MTTEAYQDWTACEFYGHLFRDNEGQRRCEDCGEESDAE